MTLYVMHFCRLPQKEKIAVICIYRIMQSKKFTRVVTIKNNWNIFLRDVIFTEVYDISKYFEIFNQSLTFLIAPLRVFFSSHQKT